MNDDRIDFVGDEQTEADSVVTRDTDAIPLSLTLHELDMEPYGDVVTEVDDDGEVKIDADMNALAESTGVAENVDKEDGDDDGRSLSDTTGDLVPVIDETLDADMDVEIVSENLGENEEILVFDDIQEAEGESDVDALPDIEGDAKAV